MYGMDLIESNMLAEQQLINMDYNRVVIEFKHKGMQLKKYINEACGFKLLLLSEPHNIVAKYIVRVCSILEKEFEEEYILIKSDVIRLKECSIKMEK